MDIKLLHLKAVIANGRSSIEPSNDKLYGILELGIYKEFCVSNKRGEGYNVHEQRWPDRDDYMQVNEGVVIIMNPLNGSNCDTDIQ